MRCNPVVRIEYLTRPQRISLQLLTCTGLVVIGIITGAYLEQNKTPPKVAVIDVTPNLEVGSESPDIAITNTSVARYVVDWNPSEPELKREIDCLAKNIYFEARSESLTGQIAVGLVTINRVISEYYPDTICGVVFQRGSNPETGTTVGQFSWTWDGESDVPKKSKAWTRAQILAGAMLAENSLFNFTDFTMGATHYHATYVTPGWSGKITRVAKIGSHIFYRDEKRKPKLFNSTQSITVALATNNKI